MTAQIVLSNLAVERGGSLVVRGAALQIERGSWFGLIGANGSGKTSLLRALSGRLPIAAGSCQLNDEDVTCDRARRASLVGFAPPTESLPQALRVRDVLALVGGSLDQALASIGDLRLALGLDAMIGRWIGDCSAGMRQRIAVAVAFSGGQQIVVLDEPFNWLDPVVAFDVKQVLREMTNGGLTLVTALHDIATLTHECEAGAMMAEGRIAIDLGSEELRRAAGNLPEFERRMIDALRSSSEHS